MSAGTWVRFQALNDTRRLRFVGLRSMLVLSALYGPIVFAADSLDRNLLFDIPAQPLSKALVQYAREAGVQVMLGGTSADVQISPQLKGTFRARAALDLLLGGSGLSYRANGDVVTIVSASALTEQRSFRLAAAASSAAADSKSESEVSSVGSNGERNSEDNSHKRDALAEVVVTGTHISGDAPTASELITIGRDEINRSGYTTVGDLLRSLPQNYGGGVSPVMTNVPTPTNSSSNPSGSSAPNLRGLGPSSTLTLIDGHRLAAGYTGGTVDISSIPLEAIDRIEVVTDGASAVYGSDAVAGVVNIILRKSYHGIEANLSFGDATDGGGLQRRVGTLMGTDWSGGNIVFAYEHAGQNNVEASQRDFTASVPNPYSLLPQSSSNSYLLSAHQNITTALSAFLEANYFDKDNSYVTTYSVVPVSAQYSAPSSQYNETAGLDLSLGNQWSGTIFGSAAKEVNTVNYVYFLPAPSIQPSSYDEGDVRSVEMDANGLIADLGTGDIRAALGGGYRNETFNAHSGLGANIISNDSRNVEYSFSELSLPLIKASDEVWRQGLDLSISGRYEHYSDFGSKAVPKVGLVYSPIKDINVRTSWGKSFRAPTLAQLYSPQSLELQKLSDSSSPSGTLIAAELSGANPTLKPESSRNWSAGMDYQTIWVDSALKLSATYYEIDYSQRLSQLPNFLNALTDPLDAPFVQQTPTVSQVQSLVQSLGISANLSGAPYNPATVAAIVDNRTLNVAVQRARGVDFLTDYRLHTRLGGIDLFLNTTYLKIVQQSVPLAPEQVLTDDAFNPPRFRGRGGVTWSAGPWSLTTLANYQSKQTNIYQQGDPPVASWTTVDVQMAFTPTWGGIAGGLRFSASVQNLFDRDPPYVVYNYLTKGLNFDPLNATPLGRFVTIAASKSW